MAPKKGFDVFGQKIGGSQYTPLTNPVGRDTTSSVASPLALGSIALSTVTSITSGIAETRAFKAQLEADTNTYIRQLEADTETAITNVGNAVTSFELQQSQNRQQIDNINRILGDKLTERGLAALKEAALLRAAAAETGTTGGTSTFAVKEAFITENMDKANLVSTARQQVRGILTAMDVSELSLQQEIDSLLLGRQSISGGLAITTDPFISGIASGLNIAESAVSRLPQSEIAKIFT